MKQNKNVLITGTTSGIGYSLAKQFAEKGYDLLLISRDRSKLNDQKKAFEQQYGIHVYPIAKNLCEETAAGEIYHELNEKNIPVHILIHNAGFNEWGAFLHTNLEKEIEMIRLHNITLLQLTKYFLPEMVKNGGGHLLMVGSTGSYAPVSLNAVYAASKAFVLNYSLALRAELKPKNIHVTVLTPGATQTMFAEKADMTDTVLFSRFVLSSDTVAKAAVRALFKRKAIVTPGIYNKLLVFSMKITPRSLLLALSARFYKRKTR